MGNKCQYKNVVEGANIYLEQVSPKFFSEIIKWRNSERVKPFINQQQELTMEMQSRWYHEIYAKRDDECLYVLIDKVTERPFGTTGFTDFNHTEKSCITGHYLIGEEEYLQSPEALEVSKVFVEYCLGDLECNKIYSHIVCENVKVINMHLKSGFKENISPKYPQYVTLAGKMLKEVLFDKNDSHCMELWNKHRKKTDQILRILHNEVK